MANYARNPIVRNYLGKMAERAKPVDYSNWYNLNTSSMSDTVVVKFEQACFDAGTEAFLENCYTKSDWMFTQMYHSIARIFLGWFMSMTTVNGFLDRGSMFVFSENQFRTLLAVDESWKAESLLDLGAGDGKVMHKMIDKFERKFATEQSPTMQWRLKENGFQILDIDKWQTKEEYSMITALNLLDRINDPAKLLQDMRHSVKLDGVVVLAVVLPYKPCFETGASFGPPGNPLKIVGRTKEEQIQSLHDTIFPAAGFEVIKFTRLPYLCEGDLHNDFFVLTDIVFVLRPAPPVEQACTVQS